MKRFIYLGAFLLGCVLLTQSAFVLAASAPPTILTYQGRLANGSGDLLGSSSGTTYYFKFSVWDSVSSGSRVWPTSAPTSVSATVRQGAFTVNIGDTTNGYPTALSLDFSNHSALYLQVEVSSDNASFETLSPRQQITAAAYAQVAGTVVGTTTQSALGTTTPYGASQLTLAATTSSATPLSIIGAASQSGKLLQVLDNSFAHLFSINSSGGVFASSSLSVGGALQFATFSSCTLKTDSSGNVTCGTDLGGTGQEVNWSWFNNSGIRLGTTTNQVLIGASATSTLAALEVHGSTSLENASTTALSANTFAVGQTGTTTVGITGALTTPSLTIGSLSGILKATNGLISAATAGTDYSNFGYLFPNNATTTAITFSGGLTTTNASTSALSANTLAIGGTGTTSISSTGALTTPSLTIGSLTGLLKAASGVVSAATAGSDYENPLTFSAPLSRSTNTISITQSGSASNGYLSSTDWNIFNNKISSTSLSAGAGISYNSTTGVITNTIGYPFLSNATTTTLSFLGGITTTNASTSAVSANTLAVGGTGTTSISSAGALTTPSLTLSNITGSTQCLRVDSSGLVSGSGADCGTGTGSFAYPFPGNATSTSIAFNGGLTASTISASGLVSLLNASSSLFSVTGTSYFGGTATTTIDSAGNVAIAGNLTGAGLTSCNSSTQKLLWDGGQFSCGTDLNTGGSGGSFPFSADTNYGQVVYSTTTPTLWFRGGFYASSTSQIAYASTTAISAVNGYFDNATVGSLSGILKATNGVISAATAGTDYQAAGTYLTALGSGYATTTQTAITLSTSTLSFNGLTLGQSVVPAAGALTFTPTVSGTLNNSGLTNSTISGISLGSNLADLTATNGTLTFSGTYNGSTARTIGLNLGNANTWTALQTFSAGASSSALSANTLAIGGTGTTSISSTGALSTPSLTVGSLSGLLYGSTGAVAAASVSAPLSFAGGTLSITQSGAGSNGYLSSSDWNLFNNKISSTSLSGGTGISYDSATGVITNTVGYPFTGANNSTSTLTQFNGGLTAYASSTIGNGTAAGGLTVSGTATTTNAVITSLTTGALLKTNSLGQIIVAVGGTDYANFGYPFPSNATTTALSFLGGITTTNASTSAISANTLAVGGTGTTTISSTGALFAPSLTLGTALAVGQGGTGATSLVDLITLGTHTTGNYVAALSNGGGLTVGSSGEGATVSAALDTANANIWTALQRFSNASSSLFSVTGTSYFGGTATTTIDSAGNVAIAGNLTGAGLTSCNGAAQKLLWSGGQFSCGVDLDTGGGGTGGFTFQTYYGVLTAATSSALWVQGGLFASSTSHFANADFVNATTSSFGVSGQATFAGRVGIGSSTPSTQFSVGGGTILQSAGNPTLSTSTNTASVTYASVVSGRHLYVADGDRLKIYDVSNAGRMPLIGTYTGTAGAVSVAVAGNYAYVGDTSAGVVILDVSNPANPTSVGSYAAGDAFGIAVSGKYVFASNYTGGNVRIIDVSNPTQPILAGTYTSGGNPYGLVVRGKYLFIANQGNGRMQIVDISNPVSPALAGQYLGATNPTGLAISGSYAYLADASAGMRIIDISNIASTTLVSTYDSGGSYYGVSVAGRYAYLANHAGSMRVLDVYNPASPVLAGSYTLAAGAPNGITVAGKYAYVANDISGLAVIDISGADLPAANIGALAADTLNVADTIVAGSNITAQGGLNVGISGIFSRGTIAAFIASTTQTSPTVASFIGGNVGIGTSTPYAALSVVGQTASAYFTATTSTASTFPYASSTALTVSGTGYFGTASTTNLRVSGTQTFENISSSGLAVNASGQVYAAATTTFSGGLTYSGGNETADLGTSISVGELASADFGSFTCNGTACTVDNGAISNAMLANSTISGVALGSNLADLTATNGTLTFSGSYNGSTARTVGLNLANANTWVALQQFSSGASTTLASIYDSLYIGGSATSTFTSVLANLASGGTFQINGSNVLTASALGSGVTASSLTSVGTLSSLTVSGQSVLGNASTTAFSSNTLAVGGTGTTTINSTGTLSTPSLTIGSLTGLLKAASGVVSAATVGTDYTAPNTATTWTALQTFSAGASTTAFSANTLAVGQTGTTTITSAGWVGVGTSTPGSILSVQNVANFVANGTTTFSSTGGGINITSGCFSINGTCVISASGGSTDYAGTNSALDALQTASSTAKRINLIDGIADSFGSYATSSLSGIDQTNSANLSTSTNGVIAAQIGISTSTGGTITQASGDWVHTFTSSGTFTPGGAGAVQYLVVAGGGGGGSIGGGGGAGGMATGTTAVTGQAYTVTIGQGGAGGSSSVRGSNGQNSVFGSVTAVGGGGGGSNGQSQGQDGGSGGGSGGDGTGLLAGGSGTAGQGKNGGSTDSSGNAPGGGGGAGAVGGNASASQGGDGGAGAASSISGVSVTYAGGGGGGGKSAGAGAPFPGGAGGSGGGGAGGNGGSTGTNGTANTGGGGGGGGYNGSFSNGGTGGSGVVIVRYTPVITNGFTLLSQAFTAQNVPAAARLLIQATTTTGAALVADTDLRAAVSRDGGTTWATTTLVSFGALEDGYYLYRDNIVDLSAQPSGTSMKYRIITASTTVRVEGVALQWGTSATLGADLAENYPTDDATLVPGEIVSFDPAMSSYIKRATRGETLAGIVSTQPGFVLGPGGGLQRAIALSGRVPVKINLEGGNIAIGDPITLSSAPGVGKKAGLFDDAVGVALEPFTASSTADSILVFVNLRANGDLRQLFDGAFGADATTTISITTSIFDSLFDKLLYWLQNFGIWVADGVTRIASLVADRFTVGSTEQPAGITLFDMQTHDPYCVTVSGGQLLSTPGVCSAASTTPAIPAGGENEEVSPEPEPTVEDSATSTSSTAIPSVNEPASDEQLPDEVLSQEQVLPAQRENTEDGPSTEIPADVPADSEQP